MLTARCLFKLVQLIRMHILLIALQFDVILFVLVASLFAI